MTVAGQRGMGGSHLDDRRAFAVRQQVVEREVHGLLRAHHQESFVVALRVAAGDSNQQRILDRKEIREVVKEVDVGRLDLGRNRNRGTAVLEALPDPEHRRYRVPALHPSQRVQIGGLDIRTADDERVVTMEVLGRGQRRPGEDVAVAVRDPVPGHLRGGGHQGIPELGVPVHDTGPDRPFAHLRDNGGEILVDRCDLRRGAPEAGAVSCRRCCQRWRSFIPRSPGSDRRVATARATSLRSGRAEDGRVVMWRPHDEIGIERPCLGDYGDVTVSPRPIAPGRRTHAADVLYR